jgi:hypothetical protein
VGVDRGRRNSCVAEQELHHGCRRRSPARVA